MSKVSTCAFQVVFMFVSALATARGQQLVPENPASFFITPETPSPLVWDVQNRAAIPTGEKYQITDYAGKLVGEGDVSLSGNKASVTVKLPRGYYDVAVDGQSFGLVSQETQTGAMDDFFGMDAVLNWLDRRSPMREAMVTDLKRSGIPMARERLNWNLIEPAPGTWNWEETDHAWALRQIYQQHGMKVLEMFHSPGAAAGPFPVKSSYPQNLVELSKAWPVIYDKFKATWGGLEVWNEPEGGFGSHLPADQYVTVVKAMRYALKTHGVSEPMGGGVFVGGDPGAFHRFCVLNGMLDDVDFVSLHDYKPATKMERLITVYRAWLKESGKEGMPLWISECGWSWPTGRARPLIAQDQKSALEITMKGVEAKACGVTHYHPFCLAFYEERGVESFSMMGKEVTPLRSMGAYVQSIRALSGKTYVGDLTVDDKSILRARVFAEAKKGEVGTGGQLVVLYTDELKPDARISLPIKAIRIEGIDGRELKLNADGSIPIPDGMVYVWTDGATINRDTAAMSLLESSRKSVGPDAAPGDLVLQYVPDPAQETYTTARYIVNQSAAAAINVKVRVHNLSDDVRKVTLRLALPGETVVQAKAREQSVHAVAQGVTEVNWTVDARGKWTSPETLPITITGEYPNGSPISPLAIPVLVEGQLDDYLKFYPQAQRLDISNLTAWTGNITPVGTMKMEKDNGAGWKLSVSFKPGDPWVYPKFKLNAGALADAEGFLLRARAQSPATVRMMFFKTDGGSYMTAEPVIPADGKWHVTFVPVTAFEPSQNAADKGNGDLTLSQIREISIGMNDSSTDHKNVLEVSDLLVVKKSK